MNLIPVDVSGDVLTTCLWFSYPISVAYLLVWRKEGISADLFLGRKVFFHGSSLPRMVALNGGGLVEKLYNLG